MFWLLTKHFVCIDSEISISWHASTTFTDTTLEVVLDRVTRAARKSLLNPVRVPSSDRKTPDKRKYLKIRSICGRFVAPRSRGAGTGGFTYTYV